MIYFTGKRISSAGDGREDYCRVDGCRHRGGEIPLLTKYYGEQESRADEKRDF